MKSILNLKYLFILAIAATMLCTSCGDDEPSEVYGCTDENAENYNPDATDSNGECTYARDKFLGTYIGKMTFEMFVNLDQDPLEFTISQGIASDNQVLIGVEIMDIPVFLDGVVAGNAIFVDDTYTLPDGGVIISFLSGQMVDVDFKGEVNTMNDGANVAGELDIVFKTDQQDVLDTATLSGERQ